MEVIYEENDEDVYEKCVNQFKICFNNILEILHIEDVNEYMKNKSYMTGNNIYDYIYDYTYNYVKNLNTTIVDEVIMKYGFNKALKRLYKYYEDKLTDTNWEFCENIKHNEKINYQILTIIFKDEVGLLHS